MASVSSPPLIRDELLEQWQWKMDDAARPNKSADAPRERVGRSLTRDGRDSMDVDGGALNALNDSA